MEPEAPVSRLPLIHTELSFVELLIDLAANVPGAAGTERPYATVRTTSGALTGTIIGCSITPRNDQKTASARHYDRGFLYMNLEDDDLAVVPLDAIEHVLFRT